MADVIIKGMEMRYACSGETDCFALDEHGDYPMCRITGETRGYTFPIRERRMDNCPIRPAPEWISVEERLPGKSGQYYVSGGNKVWICKFLVIPNFTGGWCNDASNPVVQAWMPLPEPPEGGSGE